MITGKRVKEVSEAVAVLLISAAVCWGLPFVALASPNSTGTLSAPQNMASALVGQNSAHRTAESHIINYDDITQGLLLYRQPSGAWVPSLPLDTQVSMQVSGLSNRVSVKQVFRNNTEFVLNGQYLFPLPNEAAVDSLRLHIGQRVIEGQIHPKADAKQIFEQAKAEGKRASLVSQERPNMFTTEVANLAPQEELIVEISYQETIKYEDGLFSLRFPLVVAPRYIPGLTSDSSASDSHDPMAQVRQSSRVTSSQVFDADRIVAPVRDGASGRDPVLKADIQVLLAKGLIKRPLRVLTMTSNSSKTTAARSMYRWRNVCPLIVILCCNGEYSRARAQWLGCLISKVKPISSMAKICLRIHLRQVKPAA